MKFREDVRNGKLYTSLNELLNRRLPEVKAAVEQTLKAKNIDLEVFCRLEYHCWAQCTQWRIELDFDDYEWDFETMKPRGIGAFIMLEEVEGKMNVHYTSGKIYNTFRSTLQSKESEVIAHSGVHNSELVMSKIKEVTNFLDSLHEQLIEEVQWLDFDKLERLTDK